MYGTTSAIVTSSFRNKDCIKKAMKIKSAVLNRTFLLFEEMLKNCSSIHAFITEEIWQLSMNENGDSISRFHPPGV
jgi:valyl-tRNA synthetase